MNRPNDDITEAYLKFAEVLTKNAEVDPMAPIYRNPEYIKEQQARYNTKPEGDYKYEHNIVEYAHPEPAIVALPYDIINGLVENVNEKHNIIINKITRFPSEFTFAPLHTVRKTANEVNLAKQLIRIGNDMDLNDEEELRLLADDCLDELQKEAAWYDTLVDGAGGLVNSLFGAKGNQVAHDAGSIGQGAAAGAGTGALIGAIATSWGGPLSLAGAGVGALIGAGAGGLGAYLFNTSPTVKNIRENAKDLLSQLSDVEKVVPGEAAYFQKVKGALAALADSADKYNATMNVIKTQAIDKQQSSPIESLTAEVKEIVKDFRADIDTCSKLEVEFNRKNEIGAFSAAKSSMPHFWIVADDIEDVQESFRSLDVAISKLNKMMSDLGEKTVEEVAAAKAQEDKKPTPKQESVNPAFSVDPDKHSQDFVSQIP